MALYAIEDKTCLTICEEAEIVNHTDWAALHICKTKTAALAAIADPANDGRWTDADSVKEISWTIVNAINNPTTEQPAQPTQEAQDAPQDGDGTEDSAPGPADRRSPAARAAGRQGRRHAGRRNATDDSGIKPQPCHRSPRRPRQRERRYWP